MEKLLLKIGNIIGKGRLFKILSKLSPMYRSTGGKIMEVSNNLQYVKIKLLSSFTRLFTKPCII